MALNVMEKNMVALALTFLKANWKWVLIGLFILGLVSYIATIKIERNHYKSEYEATEVKLAALVNSSKAKETLLDDGNKAISDRYANSLRDANSLVIANARLNQENIANAKELAAVKLSLNAVRLFNASKQSTTETSQPANTVQGTDGTTTPATETPVVTSTLQDLLAVTAVNDANHLVCIKTVETWQKFWIDYVNNVDASNNAN